MKEVIIAQHSLIKGFQPANCGKLLSAVPSMFYRVSENIIIIKNGNQLGNI